MHVLQSARRIFLLATTAVCFGGVAFAQTVPSSAQPGVVIRTLEGEKRAPSRLEDVVTTGSDKEDKSLSKEKVFTLKGVVLEGSTIYTPEAITQLSQDRIGTAVSFADLNEIARTITRKYREDGYIFSSAILPPQKIEGGIVRLRAVEGRVTDVQVVGDFHDGNGLIQRMADKIKAAGPSNSKDIERYLLLIDDLPGIKARSLVRPAKTAGGGELIITIEQDKIEGSAEIDNRGSEYIGQYRGTLVGAANSAFGIHDRTTLRGIMSSETDELRFVDITHEEQIGSEGFNVKGRFALTHTEPGKELKALALKGDSRLFDLEGVYPLIRGRQQNLNLIAGFNAINSQTELSGSLLSQDRVRSVRVGGHYDFTDSLAGVTQIDLKLTQGIDVFNATKDGTGRSRSTAEHDFFRTNVYASRVQEL